MESDSHCYKFTMVLNLSFSILSLIPYQKMFPISLIKFNFTFTKYTAKILININ